MIALAVHFKRKRDFENQQIQQVPSGQPDQTIIIQNPGQPYGQPTYGQPMYNQQPAYNQPYVQPPGYGGYPQQQGPIIVHT